MKVSNALKSRKSVRAFLNKDVPKELLEELFNNAKWSPSSKNIQPWKIIVTTKDKQKEVSKKIIEALESGEKPNIEYENNPCKLEGILKDRAINCGKALYSALNIQREDKEKRIEQWKKNFKSFDAPVTLFFFKNTKTDSSANIDLGILAQSIMLMAMELGLATCAQASLADYPKIVKQALDVSDEYLLMFGMSLGYEDKSDPANNYRTEREELSNFVEFK